MSKSLASLSRLNIVLRDIQCSENTMPVEALLFDTQDLDYAQEKVSEVYCPYRFSLGNNKEGPAGMFTLPGEHIVLSWFAYGADILIEPESFSDFVLTLTTLSGESVIHSSNIVKPGHENAMAVISADDSPRFRYSSDNVQLGVRIDARYMDALWLRFSGGESKFRSFVLFGDEWNKRWLASVEMLRQLLLPTTPASTRHMLLPRAEELLVLQLLAERWSGFTDKHLGGVAKKNLPAYLRRAVEHINENIDSPLTLVEIASAAQCSIRTLQRVFHDWRQIGIMQYVKEVRLQRVREDLLQSEINSVTEVATRWGFFHLSQFAADYRKKYGELPSETRRRL
ncbi:TPA: AraC family transcriptional regulator [Serratia marcescens]|nr:AraC family transcriptional regulator [Serratia marcescens]HAV2137628.1 AraC family transcriptional regulator [Serratia marcescens]